MSNIPKSPSLADILGDVMRRLDVLESSIGKKK